MAYKASTGIYEIVNTINGKRYVGSSVDLRRRKNVHWRSLRAGKHHNSVLQAAWLKHGDAAFEFRILLECAPASVVAEEQAAIDRLKPEYNLSPTAGNILGFRFTEDQCAARRGTKQTEEWKRKRAEAHVGKKRSEETRRRISAAMIGRKRKPYAAETLEKLSVAMKNRPPNPERVAKMAATKRGSTLTDEHKRKIGEASRRAWAERKAVSP